MKAKFRVMSVPKRNGGKTIFSAVPEDADMRKRFGEEGIRLSCPNGGMPVGVAPEDIVSVSAKAFTSLCDPLPVDSVVKV